MKLTLDPLDLRPEYQEGEGGDVDQAISTCDVTFEHLNDVAKQAVIVVGSGTFNSWDRQTHQLIYAPKE